MPGAGRTFFRALYRQLLPCGGGVTARFFGPPAFLLPQFSQSSNGLMVRILLAQLFRRQ